MSFTGETAQPSMKEPWILRRRKKAKDQKITQGHYTVRHISKETKQFLGVVKKYVTSEGLSDDDQAAIAKEWFEATKTSPMFDTLEFYDIVRLSRRGKLLVPPLGRQALKYLPESLVEDEGSRATTSSQ